MTGKHVTGKHALSQHKLLRSKVNRSRRVVRQDESVPEEKGVLDAGSTAVPLDWVVCSADSKTRRSTLRRIRERVLVA